MNSDNFSSQNLADILMRLNGPIEPIGGINTDNQRFENLIRLEEVLDILLDEVYFVCKHADHYEFSRQRAGKQAIAWLTEKKEWLEEVLNERNKSE